MGEPSLLMRVKDNLVRDWMNHLAGFFRAVALVQTDVLMIQSYMLTSSSITAIRLKLKRDYTQFAYVCLFASLSGWSLFHLVRERFVWLDDREAAIWAVHFDMLTQPMFKKLMSAAELRTVPLEEEAEAVMSGAREESPSLMDYFKADGPKRYDGERVLTSGGKPTLTLLLDGRARIVRSLEDDSPASWARGKGERRKTKPVLIERGAGFCGELSFVKRQGWLAKEGGKERAEQVKARSDVTFLPGSRYIIWDSAKLEALLKKDSALRNALLANLGQTTSRKLQEMTKSVGQANERAHALQHKLVEELYKQEVLDVVRHTFVKAAAGRDGSRAIRRPNGAEVLLPALRQLQAERGVLDETQERVLRTHGLDLERAAERGDSLLALCDTQAGSSSHRHNEQYKELKRVLREDKAKNRVVRQSVTDSSAGVNRTMQDELRALKSIPLKALPGEGACDHDHH